MDIRALTVKQLNIYVKSLLEGDSHLQSVAVTGEISNFKNHYASGHLYFTLKDADAAIRCVMFRSYAMRLNFTPQDGMQVVLIGRVSLYEKDGQYQFYAEQMFAAGAGELALKFEEIKNRLEKEGLFDLSKKKKLPAFPKRIAVVTSDTGAAVRDILNILSRRWPLCQVLMCPVAVQGENAVPDMLDALERVYKLNNCDVIIIGRGGGSAEDLWAFNSEELARKIAVSPVPVISAVGHETDFSISDFAADLRAPTPSAAAELAVPDCKEVAAGIEKLKVALKTALNGKYNLCNAKFEKASNSPFLKYPEERIIGLRLEQIDRLTDRASAAIDRNINSLSSKYGELLAKLDALSPLKVISRGYGFVTKNGSAVVSASDLSEGDRISLKFNDGEADCTVNERKLNNG